MKPLRVGRAAVAGAGGQDEHVAGRDLEGLALRAAELDRRAARDDGERLVRGRVEVVEVEHAGHPRAAPAVLGEQRAGRVRPVGGGLDAVVDQDGEARVVGDAVAGRRLPGLELHRYTAASSAA